MGLWFISGPYVMLLVRRIAVGSDSSPEGLIRTSWPPCPSCAAANGQMIIPEGEPGRDGANEEAEENVEAVVSEVKPSRGGDEYG